jgi:hypothetical protein
MGSSDCHLQATNVFNFIFNVRFLLGRSLETICLATRGPLFTPWNVHVPLTMALSRMLRCSILNTFMAYLHVIPCFASGQLHCGHSNDEA